MPEVKTGTLRCPKCHSKEVFRHRHSKGNVTIVVFKCMFSATFEAGLSDEEMQKRLDEFEASGRFDEWLKKPLI